LLVPTGPADEFGELRGSRARTLDLGRRGDASRETVGPARDVERRPGIQAGDVGQRASAAVENAAHELDVPLRVASEQSVGRCRGDAEVTRPDFIRPDLAGPDLGEELREDLRGRIARYKVPHVIELADALPKSAVGKVLRREVAQGG